MASMASGVDLEDMTIKNLKILVKYHMREGFSHLTQKDDLIQAYYEHSGPLSEDECEQ